MLRSVPLVLREIALRFQSTLEEVVALLSVAKDLLLYNSRLEGG